MAVPQRPGGAHREGRRAPCIRVEHPFPDGLGLCRRRSPRVRLEHPALRGRGRLLRLPCECRHLRLLRLGECRHPGHSRLGFIRLHGLLHLRCRLGRLRSRPIHPRRWHRGCRRRRTKFEALCWRSWTPCCSLSLGSRLLKFNHVPRFPPQLFH